MDKHLQSDVDAQLPGFNQCKGNPPVDSLVDRFPVEIASRIFYFTIDDPDTADTWWSKKQTKGPLILGAVNRTWRAIAWTTPQLWAFIHIGITLKRVALRTELTKEWLARSGQLPLTIVVSWMDYQTSDTSLALDPFVDTINGYANRWRSLEVKLPFTSLSRLFCNPVPQSQLEVLKIFSSHPNQHHLAPTDRLIFANVNLHPQRVQLLHVSLDSINLRWDNLMHLDVDAPFMDQCLEILSHAPQLQYCNFSGITWRGEGFQIPSSPITHSLLRELSLSSSIQVLFSGSQPLLLNALVLPSLEQLKLDIEQHTLQPLLSLIGRSSWPLRKLYLTLWAIDHEAVEDELIEVLHAISSLQEFELNAFYINMRTITDHFLARLNFPQLQIFNYTGIRFFSWEGLTVFATGFHSSGSSNSRPQTMCIRLENLEDGYIEEDYINKESLKSLILLRDAGLDITIAARRVGTNYRGANVKPEA
ncbi:hypothetical protein GALMADRAFT_205251 [Galerina marginata CBS 339.88]|uniref:F-box domain-containing protein n=1 Tax=Galerina marginata (strain CBS 339.88) TaxID=685588 RepID=A0A067TS85_GALM3|nr:hypothetical protein GALMADRAFT_205251 [Galerina marginata CBS 339.88]